MVSDEDNLLRRIARFSAEALAETLWPTRCALCDMPGAVLCERCAFSLPFLDWWRACPCCGSPFGLVQCDLCNPAMLARIGRERLPFEGCASATVFDAASGEVIRVYKDQGERRLSAVMADLMVRAIPRAWRFDAVTFVPATVAAVRRRGFDHAELLAREVAIRVGVECWGMLDRPRTRDQRKLGGRERIANLNGSFSAHRGMALEGKRMLLVDDTFTTGATLCAASDAVIDAGAGAVYGLTFARV